ncbi:MAG: glycosyltransferase family 39 protein [Candidatus Gastranaerophilales bacterium]|nr:glycosyltransferase family 39 protein [Candidatus Gastranaerophilales bacterium]
MEQEKEKGLDRVRRVVNQFSKGALAVIGAFIFAYLSWHAFYRTQFMDPLGIELPFNVPDSKLQNILVILLAGAGMAALLWLERKLPDRVQKWMIWGSVAVAAVWIGIVAFWWIHAAVRVPLADQAEIYWRALDFSHGEYASLTPGGYVDRFPRQLGLIGLVEILYALAGENCFYAFEVMCAVMTVGVVLAGYLCLGELDDGMPLAVFYSLTMLGCFPLAFYTSWMYGEIPGVFFSLWGIWMLFRYNNKRHVRWLIGGAILLSVAYLLRANSMVLIIAAVLALSLSAFVKKDWKLLIAALCTALIPNLAGAGVQQIYALRSGLEKSDGLSAWSGIVLGVQESAGRYGWDHDNYEYTVYIENNCDKEAAKAVFRRDFQERMEVFRADPAYARLFFREKILSQWNEPLYQGLYFGDNYDPNEPPEEDSLVYRLNTDLLSPLLRICDRLQMVLYFGMLLYFIWGIRSDDDLVKHIFVINVIGGFLLSVIWEAKARYIFPYYIVMFPVAAMGFRSFVLFIERQFLKH